jgi:P27 family predicted phage terminase small subunit
MPVGDLTGGAPAFLTADQREEWDHIVRSSPPGLLKAVDRRVLVAWVIAVDIHEKAAIEQAKMTGLVLRRGAAPNVTVTTSPYVLILHKQTLAMIKLASEMGFTPASRPRLATVPTQGAPLGGTTETEDTEDSFAAWEADDPGAVSIN